MKNQKIKNKQKNMYKLKIYVFFKWNLKGKKY